MSQGRRQAARRGRSGDGAGDSLLLAFGVGFSYQLGLDEPPRSSKSGGEDDGENGRGRWAGGKRERERVREKDSPEKMGGVRPFSEPKKRRHFKIIALWMDSGAVQPRGDAAAAPLSVSGAFFLGQRAFAVRAVYFSPFSRSLLMCARVRNACTREPIALHGGEHTGLASCFLAVRRCMSSSLRYGMQTK